MVEALDQNISAAAAAETNDENLLINTGDTDKAALSVPAAIADDSYEETPMNPAGFFSDNNDQVSTSISAQCVYRN